MPLLILVFLVGVFIVPVLLGAQIGALTGFAFGFHHLLVALLSPKAIVGVFLALLLLKMLSGRKKRRSESDHDRVVYIERPRSKFRR